MKAIIVGIDVSKDTLDLVVLDARQEESHDRINTVKDYKHWMQEQLSASDVKKVDWWSA